MADDLATVVKENTPALMENLNSAMMVAGEWVKSSGNFASEQVPLLIQEILYYNALYYGFVVFLGLLGMLWGFYAYRWSYRNAEARVERMEKHTDLLRDAGRRTHQSSGDTCDVVFGVAHYGVPISGAITAVIGSILFLVNITTLFKVLAAPRLFLLEYFRQLTRGM